MNKKQRNRKLVTQNKRNRMINRRYSSTIKTLSKLFLTKVKTKSTVEEADQTKFKTETKNLVNKVYSIIDNMVYSRNFKKMYKK